MHLVSLRTKRYSAVVRRFYERYPGAVKINHKVVQEPLDVWCTNKRLYNSINFCLVHGGLEVLGFHDGPRNLWAHQSTLPLVQQLAHEHVLRFDGPYEASPPPTSFLNRLLARVFGT